MSASRRVLVDTNILVYAYDRAEPIKQRRAIAVLDALVADGLGVLSTQVLAEFFIAVTRRIAAPVSVDEAAASVERYLLSWEIVDVTGLIVLEATRGVRQHQLSLWDAQIWATARFNQVTVVFSQDFTHGQSLEGVLFLNPLLADERLPPWVGDGA